MAKFVIFFSYSNEAWARMIGSPVDRSAAVRAAARLARWRIA